MLRLLVVFVLIAFGSLKIYVETAKTLKADTATKTEGFKHVGDMADYIYEMISRLGTEIEILKNGSNEFRQSLNGVTAAIDSIAEGSISVVSDTEKIAHHISELEKALSDNNGHIKQVARNMEEIIDNKNQGLQLMNELRRQSAETSGAIAEIDKMISETNETTNKIISAGETIRQISTQTRLLALNAAIEASRAGETSRGFAVIAEQIRNLSDETNKYLEEIQDYTKVLAENVDSAVGALDRVKAAMENELEDVKKMDGLLDKINASTTSTQDYIVLVNKSSDTILEQTTRIKESIESLYAANQECAANTSQSSTNMQNQAPYVESIINLINNLCGMVYSLRDKSMEIKMLIDAGLLVDYLEKEGYSNENLVKACRKLNLTTAYVADRTGYVHYCNEEIGRGVNLFEFDSSLRQLLDGVDYVATPIKKRVEDGKTYKFLSIYRNNWIYEVGLDLTRTALDQTGTN